MFKYKTYKDGCLQKCKARLFICKNQQKRHKTLTRARILAITSLHIMLALTAKFDLKTMQFDVVNTFIYADLDKTVFVRMFPKYSKNNKVLYLNKAFYDLQCFFCFGSKS